MFDDAASSNATVIASSRVGWVSLYRWTYDESDLGIGQAVLQDDRYETICDATLGAMDLYEAASADMMGYIEKVAQRHRLKKNNLDDVIGYA